ncbi:MAG TPA: antibiotic biosynthesis monooxygenase [Dehalococcoidia bacterium]|nr:antibiotic biosynthesis monooxygenase [Dehalococcoidia bacterium]
MTYVRISILDPDDAERARVEEIIDEMIRFHAGSPGFISGQRLVPDDETGEVWRVAYWQDEESADHAARHDHIMALRSQLNLLVGERRHEERGFWVAGEPRGPAHGH